MSKFSEQLEARRREQARHSGPAQSQSMSRYTEGDTSPFVEALGYGLKRGATGLGNMFLRGARSAGSGHAPGKVEHQPWSAPLEGVGPMSDSARAEDKRMFTEGGLADQPGSGLGSFVGEALSVPGPARGTQLASKAPSLFARVLGKRAGTRAVEGAVGSAQFADPEDQASAAGVGSVLSMALGRGGDALGRAGRGLVKKSEDAQQLELMLRNAGEEAHIPISLSADKDDLVSRAVGGTYKNASPFFPMAGEVLEAQRKEAQDAVRLAAYKEAAPSNFQVTPDDLKNPDLLRKKLQAEFDRLYDTTVKSYSFNVPSDYLQQMESLIKQADPKINKTSLSNVLGQIDELMAKFSDSSGQIEGQNLLYYKRAVGSLLKAAPPEEKNAIKAAVGWVDKHIDDELRVDNVPQKLADLKTYEELSPAWRSFRAVMDATEGARGGVFSPEQLARRSKPLTPERELARTADQVLGPSASRFTPAGRAMAGFMTLGAGIGLGSGALPVATAAAGGLAATTKPVQRVLTGDTTLQQTMKKLIEELHKQGVQPGNVLTQTRRGTMAEYGDE